jgi:hypothetical protein
MGVAEDLTSGRRTRKIRVHGFKAPPRQSRLGVMIRGYLSGLSGWRDGRDGLPDPAEPRPPAHVQRRVDQANAWMNGRLARRYFTEHNKLQGGKERLDGIVEGLTRTARDARLATVGPDDPATLDTPAATDAKRAATVRKHVTPARSYGTLLYVLSLVGIFAGEAVLNKKAFELFSETDRTLWVMVSGLAIAIILAAHFIGRSWKRSEVDRQVVPILVALSFAALGASFVLGTMRYLTIDNQRQQTIRLLEQQIASTSSANAGYAAARRSLQRRRHLSPSQKQSLAIINSRLAAGRAAIASAQSQLTDAQNPPRIDRAFVAIPLFAFINMFLLVVASAAGYYHFDPKAAEAVARRREERRARRVSWFAEFRGRLRDRSLRRQARREDRRRRRAIATHNAAAALEQGELDKLIQQREELAAMANSITGVLESLAEAYRAACAEAEELCLSTIRRYWAAQNRQAIRLARDVERDWRAGARGALKQGRPEPPQPEGSRWRRPASQDAPLTFQRPVPLGGRHVVSSAVDEPADATSGDAGDLAAGSA